MPLFDVQNGVTTGDQSLWNQFTDAFTGQQDADVQLFTQLSVPAAPTVAVNTTAGNLTGNYQYALGYETGYWEGPVGSGTLHTKGNTGGGAASVTVSPNGQQVDVSIPTAPTGVVNVLVYRTQANGSIFYYLTSVQANTSTQITDNALDSSLGAQMPTTNTTGGKYYGDGSSLSNVLITNKSSTTTQGVGGIVTPNALGIAGLTGATTTSRYVGAVSGVAPTTGTFAVGDWVVDTTNLTFWICTVAGSPGTWANLNYLRTDAGAPNPQTVANAVTFTSPLSGAAGFVVPTVLENQVVLSLYGNALPVGAPLPLTQTYSAGYGIGNDSTGTMYLISPFKLAWISGQSSTTPMFTVNDSGNATFAGTVTASSGQLGSASGTWTPASGTFNVAVGTVINVAVVPSGAKMFFAGADSGIVATPQMMWGVTTSSGSIWSSSYAGVATTGGGGSAAAISSVATSDTTSLVTVYDGSYSATGYFQINGGYLQFVVYSSASSTNVLSKYRWGVV